MANTTLRTKLQLRRGTTDEWAASTYVPLLGEPCLNTDTGHVRYGDGVNIYSNLIDTSVSTATATHYEGVQEDGESADEVIDRVLAEAGTTAANDDIFIVKTLIADDNYSYTAYVYNGASWVAMNGNYNAENVYFDEDLVLTYEFGKYSPDSSGTVTVPTTGLNLLELFQEAYATDIEPTTVQPSITLTITNSGKYEVGTSVTSSYTLAFDEGSYSFADTTGVVIESSSVIYQNGDDSETPDDTSITLTMTEDCAWKAVATVTYSDGDIPLTALGNEYPDGQILSGTLTATKGTIYGYRASFYGTLDDKEAELTSDTIRGLTKTSSALSSGSTFDITIPAGAYRVIIAVPTTLELSSIKDTNGMNAEIISAFSVSTASVESANAYDTIDYNVYVQTFANANDTENTYTVTV